MIKDTGALSPTVCPIEPEGWRTRIRRAAVYIATNREAIFRSSEKPGRKEPRLHVQTEFLDRDVLRYFAYNEQRELFFCLRLRSYAHSLKRTSRRRKSVIRALCVSLLEFRIAVLVTLRGLILFRRDTFELDNARLCRV